MGIFERKSMNDKTRLLTTETVLLYIDTAKQVNSDPMGLTKLNPVGSVFLGDELQGKVNGEKDSVWWVAVDPSTGRTTATQLGPDRSKWQRAIGDWLKRWGEKSPVRARAQRRGVAIGIVAAIVVAAVIAIVATGGLAAVGAGAAASTAGTAGAGANSAAAGAKLVSFSSKGLTLTAKSGAAKTIPTKHILAGAKAINHAAQSGADAETQAAMATAALPPEDAAALESAATTSETSTSTLALGALGAATLLAVGAIVIRRTR